MPALKQRGVVLLEALITVVVVSIGLLGLAGLQGLSLQAIKFADIRTQAAFQVNDIMDRIRANQVAFDAGLYNDTAPRQVPACYEISGCDSSAMAENDLFEWAQQTNALPGGQGIVCRDSTPDDGTRASSACDNAGGVYAIKIWWLRDEQGQRLSMHYQP